MTNMHPPQELQRLAAAVTARRLSLDRTTIADAAAGAGISPTTWTGVEKGRLPSPRTRVAVEKFLGWIAGSCDAILAGGDATVDPAFEAQRAEARRAREQRAAHEQVVIVDLSAPDSPVVILAAAGAQTMSETSRRRLVKMAMEALSSARDVTGTDGLRRSHG